MKENKYIYLLKNIGLMTISNFASKILSFLMVPLYTSVLSTEEYGTYDLYTTTAFLLMPLFSVCICDAVLRFTLDKTKAYDEVFSIGIKFYIRACLSISILVLVNYIFGVIDIFNQYPIFFLLYYFLCLLSDLLTQFARGLEKVFDVAVSGIISTVTTVSLNVLLLIVIPMGIKGYFIANCSAFAMTSLYLFIKIKAWRYIKIKLKKNTIEKKMTSYSSPLIFNQIAWWINNVSDRYIITWICGTAANGIFSVAYKLPSILTMFQTIFNQAWTLSAVKELDEKGTRFYQKIYKVYNLCLVLLCSILIIGNKFIAKILFAKDFYQAWQYAPFLLISVLFGSLSGLLGGVFTASKDTKIIAKTTIIGATVNTILNIALVYFIGPIGAAIATLVSNILVWFVRFNAAQRIVAIKVRFIRNLFSYICLVTQAIVLLIVSNITVLYSIETIIFAIIILINKDDISVIIRKAHSKLTKKINSLK